ncbi:ead/Ea22-like family protein [Escherichia coli]|nr:ead/Ea22-like family protein [Escherichia coli]EEV2069028.1 ead/Ea22-like family protein [Escherichia coli]EFI9033834.1 ead/Ea22-like family protein [Escherichia coli]EFK7988244.1 ead/Ea22-like family protein [Escherichia coli]EGN3768022.1 ead/Ea22-like family protein [Escherichia coli]
MKFSKFSELVNRILSNNHSHRRDMDVTIVVHSPGSIGSTPSVEVQSIHAGFDWDSGKVLIFPAQPLTTLTPEQITDITDSVRKGQSWHAYQEYKKHKEQLEKLSIELDAAKQRIAELEGNFTALAAENAGIKSAIPESRDIEDDNDNMDDVSLAEDFGFNHAIERMRRQIPETPTTDAFLAEALAQGVDAAIEAAKNLVAQEYEYKDFKAAQSDCCMYPGSDLVGKVEMTEWLVDFAAQLRKGGNQ